MRSGRRLRLRSSLRRCRARGRPGGRPASPRTARRESRAPCQDPAQRSAPAAVDGRDDAPRLVDEKDGKAIGRLHDQEDEGQGGDQGVAGQPSRGRLLDVVGVDDVNDIGVNLLEDDRAESVPVGQGFNVFEGPSGRPEPVDESGNAVEPRNRQVGGAVVREHPLSYTGRVLPFATPGAALTKGAASGIKYDSCRQGGESVWHLSSLTKANP